MREARYTHLVAQSTDFSCGAAALATILKYAYGKNTNEDEVMRGMLQVSDPDRVRQRGFSLLNMKHFVQTLGLRGRGFEMRADVLHKIKIPTIVLLDIKGYKHFTVLKKATHDKVYLADPALGNKSIGLKEFAAGWNGVVFAVIGDGLDMNSVLLTPAEPLSARRLLAVHAMIPETPLLDFGFLHANLF
jgi:Predicted double-glycine peptidase